MMLEANDHGILGKQVDLDDSSDLSITGFAWWVDKGMDQ
jgi:hypothetical protein